MEPDWVDVFPIEHRDIPASYVRNYQKVSSYKKTGWWFQTIWKILVKMGIFPKFRVENKTYLSCHHPEKVFCNRLVHRFFFTSLTQRVPRPT